MDRFFAYYEVVVGIMSGLFQLQLGRMPLQLSVGYELIGYFAIAPQIPVYS